jgi:hypothetical protein
MWCPDGFFLVREFFNDTFDVVFDEIKVPPLWLGDLGEVSDAVRTASARFRAAGADRVNRYLSGHLIPYDDQEYVSELDWPYIYFEAVRHWLMGRFLSEEKYSLFVVLPSETCVRVSSEAAHFVLGHELLSIDDGQDFPRAPEELAKLAMGVYPFNSMFPPPAYILRVGDVREKANGVHDIMRRQLAPMDGASLAWKARSGETPRTVLARLLGELMTGFERDDEQRQRSCDSGQKLQVVLDEVWQAFPDGKGANTWTTVVKRSGHSRRQIERAFKMYGGRDRWAEGGQ